jgi:S1-C subfamily serine protease
MLKNDTNDPSIHSSKIHKHTTNTRIIQTSETPKQYDSYTNTSIVKIISQNVTIDQYNPYKTLIEYEGIGTGFFIDNNGYILTCAHVIDESIKIFYTIPGNGKDKKEAELVSICFDRDIALLRSLEYISSSYLPLGNSDEVKQGDRVVALGYPLAQDRMKQTSGIISGRQGRFFQTDTPINSGNSGGPLLNLKNEVIGINTSKIPSKDADNIGFSTPIHDYIIMDKLMRSKIDKIGADKIIIKPYLIFNYNNTDKNIHEYLKNGNSEACPTGFYVNEVFDKSPLKIVGIIEGDLLCEIDGYPIDNYGECTVPWTNDKVFMGDLLHRYLTSDIISLKYWSSKSEQLKTVKINFNKTNPFNIRIRYTPLEEIEYEILGGMIIMPLTLNHLVQTQGNNISSNNLSILTKYTKTKYRMKDVLIITSILPGSYARQIDIFENGEILTHVNNKPVSTLAELNNTILNNTQTKNNKKYITLKSFKNTFMVLDVVESVKETEFLMKYYKYNYTSIYKTLLNLTNG